MKTRTSLFERYPEACEIMSARGYGPLVEMSKYMLTQSQMAKLIGLAPNGPGVSKWFLLHNNPSKKTMLKIKKWVDENKLPPLTGNSEPFIRKPAPIPIAKLPKLEPPKEVPKLKDDVAVLMVVCPIHKQEKITRILEMLLCEVVEV